MFPVSRLLRAFLAGVSFAIGTALAQEAWRPPAYAVSTIGSDAGLPSNVAAITYQTRDGYLWIGTDAGLARYDGVRLKVYRKTDTPGLADNLIRGLHEDREGTLWIATQGGLSRRRGDSFELVNEFNGRPVAGLAGDGRDRVWIATERDGVWQYAGGAFMPVTDEAAPQARKSLTRVFADSAGHIWLAGPGGGVVTIQDSRWITPAWAGADFPEVNRFAEGPVGTLWIATTRGLYRLRDGELKRWSEPRTLSTDSVTDVFVDRAAHVWIVARSVYVAESADVPVFNPVMLPQVDFCRSVMEDREGSLWIGTAGDNIVRLRASALRMALARGTQQRDIPRSLSVDADGVVWAGLGSRGIARIENGEKPTPISVGTNAEGDVWSVCATPDGAVWFGTRGSLGCWRDGRIERFPALQNVRTIFADRRGGVWFGPVNGGVHRFSEGQFTNWSGTIGTPKLTVSVIAEAPDGAVYFGLAVTSYADGGLVRLKDGDCTVFDARNGLPDPDVRAIHVDADGDLWVGSKHRALSVWHDGHWLTRDAFSEAFSDLVNGIAEDDDGNLWLGTPRGLVWARKDNLLAVAQGRPTALKYQLAGAGDGVLASGVGFGAQPEWARLPDGELWFASRGGVVAAQPRNLRPNTVAPIVRVEGVSVDGASVPSRDVIELPAGTHSLAIDYTALSFVKPGRVTFRYRMDGHDRDWIEADTRRSAFYGILKPGPHVFRVSATNEDGVTSATEATFRFEQRPWFYQTPLFLVTAPLALAALVAGLYFWRTASLRHRVAEQTALIHQQLEKEAQLKAELERTARLESLGLLAGGIAHDFNNLLTVILGNLSLASLDPRAQSTVGENLREAERGARRARDLTQQLLTFAKGGDPVRSAVSLPDIVREATEFALRGAKVRAEFTFAPNLPPASADAGQISRVVHNLVLNAVQAMADGGLVRIAVGVADLADQQVPTLSAGCYVTLSVSDNGPGIAAEHLSRVFDPYFTTKIKSSGLGLAASHSIVQKHGGRITVESKLGKGTTFHIWLPAAAEKSPVPQKAETEMDKLTPGNGGIARVLFMDDERTIRSFATALLKRLGHDVTAVADGREAVRVYKDAHAHHRPFDVVILDLTVPGGMGGREAIEALKQFDPGVRAIVSSGYSSDPVLANHEAYGFREVVPKPYELTDLAQAVQRVLKA